MESSETLITLKAFGRHPAYKKLFVYNYKIIKEREYLKLEENHCLLTHDNEINLMYRWSPFLFSLLVLGQCGVKN